MLTEINLARRRTTTEMPNHSLRKSFKSVFQSHVDPEKEEELKGTKSEIEGKVQKILYILKTEDDKDGKEKLMDMIEDFHNHYQSLFDRYDHLTEALRRRVRAKQEKHSSSSSSDSDSDSDVSPKKKGTKNEKSDNNFKNRTPNIKQELEIAYSLITEKEASIYSTEEEKRNHEDLRTIMEQLKHEKEALQLELEAKRGAFSTLEGQLESAEKEVAKLSKIQMATEEENNSLSLQILQLKNEIKQSQKTRDQETSEFLIQIETLKEELAKKSSEFIINVETLKEELVNKTFEQQKTLEEREHFAVRAKDIELKINSLSNLKDELEELLRMKSQDVIQLQEEKEKLKVQNSELDEQASNIQDEGNKLREEKAVQESKISELQKILTEREEKVNALQKKLYDVQNEASFQITDLSEEVNHLRQEKEQLQSEKTLLEMQIEGSKQESMESLAQLDNQNTKLQNKIIDQEEKLKEQEGTFFKLREVQEKLEVQFRISEEKLKTTEKMEEIIEQFQKDVDLKNHKVDQLEENMEDLKRDLEMKGDEVSTLVENLRTTEVKLRLTSQKLRITEQLLTEKEDNHRSKEEKSQEEQKLLKESVATMSGTIETYKKAQLNTAKEISEKVTDTLTGIDSFSVKFEEDYGHLKSRIHEIVNELEIATNWIKESNGEKHRLKKEIGNFIHQLKDEKERELLLRAKVRELETTMQKDENEKIILTKIVKQGEEKMTELEKMIKERDDKMGELETEMNKKEVGFLSLAEQKREAIKQLLCSSKLT
ncbi:COP1-interactive protein 1 [Forsythia ovata]|uniref:COP1-interactive protein 1 n=1 Tax=Forsythia ovata TaxID=205694 RepID=A0ABD1WN35_9LAMI